MHSTISKLLGGVRLGEPVTDAGLTLIPVFADFPGAPQFLTLSEAIGRESLVITEVDAGGSVPELRAANRGDVGVLILDGEEVLGAKQNRVLNTSVYLAPGSEILIPVSCTEQGRWNYISDRFSDSGYLSSRSVRCAANESVTENLRQSESFRSDQGRVWDEVEMLHARHAVSAKTHAMRDVYEADKARTGRRREIGAAVPGQCGVFGLWGGRVIGFDAVGDPTVYAQLHERLVRSYTLDAWVESAEAGENDLFTAKEFLVSLAESELSTHESPGDGVSTRFTGTAFTGSVLTVDDAILHAVCFASAD